MSTIKDNEMSVIFSITEEIKDQNNKYNLSKFEFEFYHEESSKPLPIVRVKRFSSPNKGEKWKIFEDNKVMFTIDGAKLNNKEKHFLKTVAGVIFLLDQYKSGIKSFSALKNEIKNHLKINFSNETDTVKFDQKATKMVPIPIPIR